MAISMTRKTTVTNTSQTLPSVGRGKWSTIEPFVGICRESARTRALAGKFPRAIKISATCALYDFAEVHKWIADPANYRVGQAVEQAV